MNDLLKDFKEEFSEKYGEEITNILSKEIVDLIKNDTDIIKYIGEWEISLNIEKCDSFSAYYYIHLYRNTDEHYDEINLRFFFGDFEKLDYCLEGCGNLSHSAYAVRDSHTENNYIKEKNKPLECEEPYSKTGLNNISTLNGNVEEAMLYKTINDDGLLVRYNNGRYQWHRVDTGAPVYIYSYSYWRYI